MAGSPRAAVDIGTNSVRLLVVDSEGRELTRQMRITRLGQGVDTSGALHPDAISRTVSVLADYRGLIESHGATRVRAAATSAARDATNRDVFFDAAEAALGGRPELLPAEEEARLSFLGATSGLPAYGGPFLVFDLGGGSTEFVFGQDAPEALTSVKLGCVRLTERHIRTDPPTHEELVACFTDAKRELTAVQDLLGARKPNTVVGLAGTVTSLAALALGLSEYDPKKTHLARLSRREIEGAFARVAGATIDERRKLLIQPERAEVIVGGGAILVTILRELGIAELVVSEADILDGLAASIA
jgi:exopolyphosphatase/guanosine-5'-triphosphate,3'-diphosphate pyrophosphatase